MKSKNVEMTFFRHMLERMKKSSPHMRQGQLDCIVILMDNGFKPTAEDLKFMRTINDLAGIF